ncbi:MAG: serine/threonine protein phosphatase, partial [Bdellovibrionales bacterium]|nr:serine/threonine protein phosphatase [Bdellovibrionales bacterium]NQZ20389.1 serine/threonine protein phosphatase [Bdellovibrionales bacterium]
MNQNRIFAIGDIHGCAEELNKLISLLPLNSEDTLVFLGDYIDRGPNSKKVVDIILDLKKNYNVICLKGNHEAMINEFIDDPSSPQAGLFIMNGGSSTLA